VDVPELRQARALWRSNRFDEALQLFEAAVKKYPQNLVALVDGSRALGARFEIKRAEAMLHRLRKLAGQRPDILHLVGQSYRMIFRPNEAIECFEKVVALTKDIPDAYLELAVLYERRHKLDEALALIDNCLRAAPDYLEAELFKARLVRRQGLGAESEELFRRLSENEKAEPQLRAQAFAEIAQLLDQREDYRGAMAAMLSCKELVRPREGPILHEAEAVMEELRNLSDGLTASHFQRWAAAAKELPPVKAAALTSFPRSGTTLLEQVLDSHSGLVSSDERQAFARDIFPSMWLGPTSPAPTAAALDAISLERVRQLRQRYFDYMAAALNEPIGERMHLDKNPPLTLVLPGFLRLLPEAKLLIALRDPRDVVISCFMQYLPLNPNSVCFLTLERTAKRYENDMETWRRLREMIASPWLEIRYEDVVRDLPGQARHTIDFLGLPWEDQVLSYRERLKTKAVGSPTYEAVKQPLYTKAIGRWKHYEEFLAPCMPILEPSIRAFGY